jgi:hypothetical protein
MPERFGANKLMKEAFEVAWRKARLVEHDNELIRYLLASAIIDQVNTGGEDPDQIAAAALATLAAAKNISS